MFYHNFNKSEPILQKNHQNIPEETCYIQQYTWNVLLHHVVRNGSSNMLLILTACTENCCCCSFCDYPNYCQTFNLQLHSKNAFTNNHWQQREDSLWTAAVYMHNILCQYWTGLVWGHWGWTVWGLFDIVPVHLKQLGFLNWFTQSIDLTRRTAFLSPASEPNWP